MLPRVSRFVCRKNTLIPLLNTKNTLRTLAREKKSTGYWLDVENQRKFFQKLAKSLEIKSFEDWYPVNSTEIRRHGGDSILNVYGGARSKLFPAVFPEFAWDQKKFDSVNIGAVYADPLVQKSVLIEVGKKLHIAKWEDWYHVRRESIMRAGGKEVLGYFGGSVSGAIISAFSDEYKFKPWLFDRVSSTYWEIKQNRIDFFEDLGKKLGINKWQQWYNVTRDDVIQHGGRTILRAFDNSIIKALADVYPQYPWHVWLLGELPENYWKSTDHQRDYFLDLAKRLGFSRWEDWYQVSSAQLQESATKEILDIYGGSIPLALLNIFPEHPWRSKRFAVSPEAEFWSSPRAQRDFFDQLAKKLKISRFEDWYSVTSEAIRRNGGEDILDYVGDKSFPLSLKECYSKEYDFEIWKFAEIPSISFESHQSQRAFLDYASKQLGIKHLDDWYQISRDDLLAVKGGSQLLDHFTSLMKALLSIYPEHKWKLFKFSKVPDHFWDLELNVREYIEWIAKELGITRLEDWHYVSRMDFTAIGGSVLLDKYGGMHRLLAKIYPHFDWDTQAKPRLSSAKVEKLMYEKILGIFKSSGDVLFKHVHPLLQYPKSGQHMELDVYIPSLKLAFEYQGEQHFHYFGIFTNLHEIRRRDEEKRQACKEHGILLIEVPYWWDRSTESLVATIKEKYPAIEEAV